MTFYTEYYTVMCYECGGLGHYSHKSDSRSLRCSTCDGKGWLVKQVEVVEPVRDVKFTYFTIGDEV